MLGLAGIKGPKATAGWVIGSWLDAGHFARPKSGSKVLTISVWLFVYHNTNPLAPGYPDFGA